MSNRDSETAQACEPEPIAEKDAGWTGPTYGMCLACRSIEVALVEVTGTRDFSNIGEHPEYPVGYGCEACS